MLPSTLTRSFLAHNVDTMLEHTNAIRQRNKINSDDLFGEVQNDAIAIPWKRLEAPLSDLHVLLLEKESLGIYVSGNPLGEYLQIQSWVRDNTFTDSIYLVIINKSKKIFTKSNNMMFALDLSTTGDPVEGIIFPKLAPHYSNVIEEKRLYWVRGKISQKKKKTPEHVPIPSLTDTDMTHTADDSEPVPETITQSDIKEYDELPKLIIDALSRFEDGPLPLFDDATDLSTNRIAMIEAIDWQQLALDPTLFATNNQSSQQPSAIAQNITPPTQQPPQRLELKKHLGATMLKRIHQHISTTPLSDSQKIELWVETNGELKKVQGTLWLPTSIINEINNKI